MDVSVSVLIKLLVMLSIQGAFLFFKFLIIHLTSFSLSRHYMAEKLPIRRTTLHVFDQSINHLALANLNWLVCRDSFRVYLNQFRWFRSNWKFNKLFCQSGLHLFLFMFSLLWIPCRGLWLFRAQLTTVNFPYWMLFKPLFQDFKTIFLVPFMLFLMSLSFILYYLRSLSVILSYLIPSFLNFNVSSYQLFSSWFHLYVEPLVFLRCVIVDVLIFFSLLLNVFFFVISKGTEFVSEFQKYCFSWHLL